MTAPLRCSGATVTRPISTNLGRNGSNAVASNIESVKVSPAAWYPCGGSSRQQPMMAPVSSSRANR
ncbi:Uncharacterised protein [Mycobacteroides abscessus subsp. abscessus]|nr:Uncharacterised protein [Mycobacteroides abscessus subsp. abscessus]